MFNRSQKAFSLVELIVTIAIIAVVSAAALASISTIQKNSRDTQRQADLRILQSALQQFYANENRYPDSMTLSSLTSLTNCTGVAGCTVVTRTYMNNIPKDPSSGTTTPYCYTSYLVAGSSTTCTSSNPGLCHFYKLHAKQENPSGSSTYTCNSIATYNLEVTPL